VRLVSLPRPDQLVYQVPKGHVCLVVNDGTPLTGRLAQALSARGWKVVILGLPAELVPGKSQLPAGLPLVAINGTGEEVLDAQLGSIRKNHGPVGMFVHLHPHLDGPADAGQSLFSEQSSRLLEWVFLCAKHLKENLVQASTLGRAAFLTVTRLDGAFGLESVENLEPVSAGLSGLVKTLAQEWETVHCRAVDIARDLDDDRSHEFILAEIDDPNRLISETAYSREGRVSLVVETQAVH